MHVIKLFLYRNKYLNIVPTVTDECVEIFSDNFVSRPHYKSWIIIFHELGNIVESFIILLCRFFNLACI